LRRRARPPASGQVDLAALPQPSHQAAGIGVGTRESREISDGSCVRWRRRSRTLRVDASNTQHRDQYRCVGRSHGRPAPSSVICKSRD
jgi:hypothetical protein